MVDLSPSGIPILPYYLGVFLSFLRACSQESLSNCQKAGGGTGQYFTNANQADLKKLLDQFFKYARELLLPIYANIWATMGHH